MPFSNNSLVAVTRQVETTPGVAFSAARDRVYGTAPTYTPGGETLKSGLNVGTGVVHSVRAGLRYADASVPSEMVFGLNHPELEDFMRDTFSTRATASTTATWDPAGTRIDGSTGPVITAGAGAFDNLLACAGCMLVTTDPTTSGVDAANLRPRVIYAVKPDGTQIDLDARYTAGSAGQISENIVSEGPLQATFDCGQILRNQGYLDIRTINLEFEFRDHRDGPNSSFTMVRGLYAGTYQQGIDGKGLVTQQVDYVGMDYDNPTQTTQGNGTVNENAYVGNTAMSAGQDLTMFLVNGTTQLAGDNLTNFSLNGNGNASPIDEVSGSRNRAGATMGDIDFTGSLTVLHEHTKSTLLAGWGRAGTLVPLDWRLGDPQGNYYWHRLPETLLEPNLPTPGNKDQRTDASVNFMTQGGDDDIRTFIIQAFAAP